MCLKLYKKLDWDDEKLRASCADMVEQIEKSGISIGDDDEGEEDEEDENEWEDEDEDVEMEDAN